MSSLQSWFWSEVRVFPSSRRDRFAFFYLSVGGLFFRGLASPKAWTLTCVCAGWIHWHAGLFLFLLVDCCLGWHNVGAWFGKSLGPPPFLLANPRPGMNKALGRGWQCTNKIPGPHPPPQPRIAFLHWNTILCLSYGFHFRLHWQVPDPLTWIACIDRVECQLPPGHVR